MPTLKKVLDLKSIGAGVPLSIKEDSLGNIWVATDYGLVVCRTDRDKLAGDPRARTLSDCSGISSGRGREIYGYAF